MAQFLQCRSHQFGRPVQRLVAVLLWIVLCGSFGCGRSNSGLLPVSGTVTFNREPVPKGRIVMWSLDEKVAPDAGNIVDGKFDFRAHAGSKRIEIQAERAGVPDSELSMPTRIQYIPAKYNAKSNLTIEVSSTGDNHFDFALSN